MNPLDKLRGVDVPTLTTEQLHKAGAFGVAVPGPPPSFRGEARKPVDERISDAFERLLEIAKEDDDLDLVAVVGVIRALWMADAMIVGWRALVDVSKAWEGGSDANHG